MRAVFLRAGIEITKEKKREVDRMIHQITGVEYKSCPDAWREVKRRISEDEGAFVSEFKTRWLGRNEHPPHPREREAST